MLPRKSDAITDEANPYAETFQARIVFSSGVPHHLSFFSFLFATTISSSINPYITFHPLKSSE
jgi:hypothetical protein